MKKPPLPFVLAALSMLFVFSASTSCKAQQEVAAGQHVEVDPAGIGNWQGGTVVKVDPMRGYVVQLDAGYEVNIPFTKNVYPPKPMIRGAGADAGGANGGGANGAAGNGNFGMGGMNGAAPGFAGGMNAAAPAGMNIAPPQPPAPQQPPALVQANGPLTEAIVRQLIQQNDKYQSPGNHYAFKFGAIQIAAPHQSGVEDLNLAQIHPGLTVYPVRVNYSITSSGPYIQTKTIDNRQSFLFWKDQFGQWTYSPVADPNNWTSGYHY